MNLKKMQVVGQKLLLNMGYRCPINIRPAANIRKIDTIGWWESSGEDPQFIVAQSLPPGWIELSWEAAAQEAEVRLFRLYMDYGQGFTEAESIQIACINGSKPAQYNALFYIKPGLRYLRLDPGEGKGSFYLANVKLKKINVFVCLVEKLTHKPNPIYLVPVFGLARLKNGYWDRVENDPHFVLQRIIAPGWFIITFEASVVGHCPMYMRLYMDRGQGFIEEDSLFLGRVTNRKERVSTVVYIDSKVRRLRLDPGEEQGAFYLADISAVRITELEARFQAIFCNSEYHNSDFCRGASKYRIIRNHIRSLCKVNALEAWNEIHRQSFYNATEGEWNRKYNSDYKIWIEQQEHPQTYQEQTIASHAFSNRPLISVLVPVYNTDEQWLRKCIQSVIEQTYPYWELCIADDASTLAHVRNVLEEYAAKDQRIKVIYCSYNRHISETSNAALNMAVGEFVALLDHDDELAPNALYENALLINKHPDADFIYSDEDKIDVNNQRYAPFFKPDWSPDLLLSHMYTCHLGVYRTTLIKQIGGFRKGFEGSQDYDLVLRLTEQTSRIYHIPKILYHWRSIQGSTASSQAAKNYAGNAGLKALNEALERRKENGRAEKIPGGWYRVRYSIVGQPLISIIIPTRDMADVLEYCLKSIFEKSTYTNFEVIIVDNGSVCSKSLDLFNRWQALFPSRFRVLYADIPFNYSTLNNLGASVAKGELLLLLNNDIAVISENWLEEMAGQALRTGVGAVGAKLLYSNRTIQHAGITLGVGGVANHGHRGYTNSSGGYFGILLITANYASVTGACLMVRKSLYHLVGGLDEQLAVAYNDVDFCLRLLKYGFYNVMLSHVELFHYESVSRGAEDTPAKRIRLERETTLMLQRWGNLIARDPFYSPNLTLDQEDFSIRIK